MPVNTYFNKFEHVSEQTLYENLVIECIQINGMDVYFIPRTLVNYDYLYHQDNLSSFEYSYQIEMYLESSDAFTGSGDLISKFGLQINDSGRLVVSQKRFADIVTAAQPTILYPREGDLIYFPLSKGLFEIKFCEHESPFYQLGKNYVYKLDIELFKFSQEDMSTTVTAVDDLAADLANESDETVDVFAQNAEIEDEADTVLDTTEANPFGVP